MVHSSLASPTWVAPFTTRTDSTSPRSTKRSATEHVASPTAALAKSSHGRKGSAAVFGLPCDIVMPCALGDAVGEAEAQTITAKLVVEGANGPLTPGADHVLADRGVVVIPDVYANAGGVTCSYLEQCQNFAHLTWDEDEVNARVIDLMRAAFEKFYAFAQESGLPYRLAASVLGVKTIADAHRMRGLHP
ncbi:MAG: hypothetical protein EBQ75_05830 [Actinobacteria bacterium]|nr:hypothetical protein [Actinomycetota bacterium]